MHCLEANFREIKIIEQCKAIACLKELYPKSAAASTDMLCVETQAVPWTRPEEPSTVGPEMVLWPGPEDPE